MNLRKLYDELLSTGDLFEIYDGMVGTWEEDKKKLKAQQEALESFSNNIEIDIDDQFID